jgi:hypothetical protein
MAKKKRNLRAKLTTLIVVGEGPHDKAFLKHMQKLYDGDTGQKVTIDSADGGSPYNIINSTDRKYKHAAFNRRIILMDSDVTIRQQDRDLARKNKIEIITSEPLCLEGMLLEVLKRRVPATAQACKAALHPDLSGHPTQPESYSELFPKPVLDITPKQQIQRLKEVISNGTA